MLANSFGSGCCETVRCDAACIPGRCFQDVLHGKIVFTFHVFPSSEFLFMPKLNQERKRFRSSTGPGASTIQTKCV